MLNNFGSWNSLLPSRKGLDEYERQIESCIVNPQNIQDTLDNIGGLRHVKEDIRASVLLPLKHAKLFFSSRRLMPSRGIILHGPPGTGKTMLARAIASEAHVPFISLSLSSLENKFYGESSKLIRGAFTLARKLQPCIVFFDEIDGLLRQRTETEQGASYGFKTELLAQIDGMESKHDDSIFIIGTTNNVEALDVAIRRRLPKVYEVELPNQDERLQILQLKLAEEDDLDDRTVRWLAEQTSGFSGSDLGELVRRACSARLRYQCRDPAFLHTIACAKCADDISQTFEKQHFVEALQSFGDKYAVQYDEDDENTENDDEESPPLKL